MAANSVSLLHNIALILLVLSCINLLFPVKDNNQSNDSAGNSKSYRDRLKSAAMLITAALLFWIVCSRKVLAIGLISLSVIVMIGFSICFSLVRVWYITKSMADRQFDPTDNNALGLLGIFLGLLGTACFTESVYTDIRNHLIGGMGDVLVCFILVALYAFYLFLVVTQAIRPLKYVSQIVGTILGKAHVKCLHFRKMIVRRTPSNWDRPVFSEGLNNKQNRMSGWKKPFIQFVWLVVLAVDVIVYVIQFVAEYFVWMPLICGCAIFEILANAIGSVLNKIYVISDYRVAVISFRIAIVASFLLVVTMNRVYGIVNSENVTAVLEFVSSVVIIPVLFDWLLEAFRTKESNRIESN